MRPKIAVYMVGCGNAYDSQEHNSGLLVKEGDETLLIDCGPWIPRALLNLEMTADEVSTIYITHSHPDHCLGLTTLLNWMQSKGRTKPLNIIVQSRQHAVIQPLIDFAFWPEPCGQFPIRYLHSEMIDRIGPWSVQLAPTHHSVSNLGLQLSSVLGITLFYSGDGALTDESARLAAQSDWVFVECESVEAHSSHGSWNDIVSLVKKPGSLWRLYHNAPLSRPALRTLCYQSDDISVATEGETFQHEGAFCE